MKSVKVRIWAIRTNYTTASKKNAATTTGKRRARSHTVRWIVGTAEHSATFAHTGLAETFRTDLLQAARAGEPFDTTTGLPDSLAPARGIDTEIPTLYALAQRYVETKWPRLAAKSRDNITDALATLLPALVTTRKKAPPARVLRTALRRHGLLPETRRRTLAPEQATALHWLETHSRPVADLNTASVVRAGLDALTVTLDGTPAAAITVRRKRGTFHNLAAYAVELDLLDTNPVHQISWSKPTVSHTIDRRVVINPTQARHLLTAATYLGTHQHRHLGHQYAALFASMYYAALRPAEAVALRADNCQLPARCNACGADLTTTLTPHTSCDPGSVTCDWGLLILDTSTPQTTRDYTDTGHTHDQRGLKHRPTTDTRDVPIPPVLVHMLRHHITRFGLAHDGRLFHSPTGGLINATSYTRAWRKTRTLALTPNQATSPLARRPYDLRHAGVSLWLNAGVPATEVARRAGHTVEILLRVYAKCLDGQHDTHNHRIGKALGGV